MRPIEFQILLTLASGERHGYAIIQHIGDRSRGTVTVETGTLYRALQRLLDAELVRMTEPPADVDNDDERRRYYAITPAGKRAAADEARRMASLVDAARAARIIPEAT